MSATLGVDTSCYTTSLALADNGRVLKQERRLLPVPKGERGLRQSEMVFEHVRQLPELFEALRRECEEPIGAVCASKTPTDAEDSYMPVFMAGVSFARGIAAALNVPLFYSTHQRGHIRAALYESGLTSDRFLALHLSGGTTELLEMNGCVLTPLGESRDLHAGQLIDRVGVALDLPFPAGPYLEEMAMRGEAKSLLPVCMEKDNLSCHLSGAETRALQWIKDGKPREDIAAEVFDLIARTVLRMLAGAKEKTGVSSALLAGGVTSSLYLRELLRARSDKRALGLQLYFGQPQYSGDNAAGAALLCGDELKEENR